MTETITKKTKVADLHSFDITEMLQTEQDIAEYLSVVIDDGDPAMLAVTLGDIARARGMTQIAKDSGLTREALYKALRPGASPRFDNYVFQRQRIKPCYFGKRVGFIDVSGVMLAMMELHRRSGNHRFKRVVGIGKRRQGDHCKSPA